MDIFNLKIGQDQYIEKFNGFRHIKFFSFLKKLIRNFPGDPVANTPCSGGAEFDPWPGN